MKRSYSASQVKSRFETVIRNNNASISSFEHAASDASAQKTPIRRIYQDLVESFVTSLIGNGSKEEFGAIKSDYQRQYTRLEEGSSEAKKALDILRATESNGSKLSEMKFQDVEAKKDEATKACAAGEIQLSQLTKTLEPVESFNTQAVATNKYDLSAGNISYFSSKTGIKGFFARLFDTHYKTGRKLIKDFAKQGLSIPAVQDESTKQSAVVKKLQADKKICTQVSDDLRAYSTKETSLKASLRSDEAISNEVKRSFIADFENEAFFNDITKQYADQVPSFLIEARAKVAALDKIESRAKQQAADIKKMAKKLEEAMPKLRQAAGNYRAGNINIDLDGIEDSFKKVHAKADKDAKQIKNLNKAVGDYKPGTYNDNRPGNVTIDNSWSMTDIYFNIMLYDMLIDHSSFDVDMGIMNSTFDIPSSIADDMNVNFDGFNANSFDFNANDIDAATGLTDSFNSTIDNFSVPDIADFSIPDISIPDIDFGSTMSDFGSSISDSFSSFD